MELAIRGTGQVTLTGQADSDAKLIGLWLHDKSRNTQDGYRADIHRLVAFVGDKPLVAVTLADLQAFADSLATLAPASRNRFLSSVKSLLSFGHEIGYLTFNVGAALKLRTVKNRLAERILAESDVHKLIAMEPNTRNQVLLRLLYAAGLRVSEACGLTWKDTQDRGEAGQLAVYGKGDKTRHILLSADTWKELVSLRNGFPTDAPVFRSRKGGTPLTRVQVMRIVRAAATRAGVEAVVSPHWLRHAHASHALDRGCPISLVQATLGHASVSTTGRYLHARPDDSSARHLGV